MSDGEVPDAFAQPEAAPIHDGRTSSSGVDVVDVQLGSSALELPAPPATPAEPEVLPPAEDDGRHARPQQRVHYAASEPGDGSVTRTVPTRVLEEFAASEGGTSPTAGSLSEARPQGLTRERGRSDEPGRRNRQRSASVTETHLGPPRVSSQRRATAAAPGRGQTGFVRSSSKPNLRDMNKANKAPFGGPRATVGASRLRPPDVAGGRFPPDISLTDASARVLNPKLPGKRPPQRPFPVLPQRKGPKDLKEAVRRWYKFDKHGMMTIVNADKYELMEQLGVHTRDLRILDPSLTSSYPSCILSREHALVVNLEFVQVIITTDTTIVLNAENDKVHPFVVELQRRLSSSTTMPALDDDELNKRQAAMEALDADATQEVSYELKVLEVCLETIANHMAGLVTDLESSAYPALDSLTSRVNASNLERVRRVKNRMVRLNTRVETIRAVLEKYLDDDEDMEDLNLTGKQEVAKREFARSQARMEKRAADFARYEAKRTKQLDEDANASISSFSSSSADTSVEDKSWLSEQVEMLLEPYFMSFDNTWNRIQTLAEYIDDTEDLINITLDSHRNQLIQIDLLLTAATFCVGLVTTVAGLYGMNLNNGNNPDAGPKHVFDLVSILSSVLAIALLVVFVLFIRWKGLAFN